MGKIFSRFTWAAMLAVALCSGILFGAEAAAPATTESVSFFNSPAFYAALTVVGVTLIGLGYWALKQWNWFKSLLENNVAAAQAVEAIHVGVIDTYQNYVKALKDGAEDGKLTEEEKKAARDKAIAKAIEVAKGPGFTFLKEASMPTLQALVQQVVNKLKKDPVAAAPVASEVPAATPAQ